MSFSSRATATYRGPRQPETAADRDTATEALFQRLSYVEGPVDVVELLHGELGLTEKDLAKAAGVREESVSRWLGGGVSNLHARDAINDLRYVVMVLLNARTLSLSTIAYWLSARNVYLGVAPVEAISRGGFEQVAEVALAYAEGRMPDLPGLADGAGDRARAATA